jgi:hypothetical protein
MCKGTMAGEHVCSQADRGVVNMDDNSLTLQVPAEETPGMHPRTWRHEIALLWRTTLLC